MAIEIERKFLIKFLPNEKINHSHNIKQGYIVSDKDKVIRIRKKNDKYFFTIKGNTIGLSRQEFEYSIPKDDGKELLDNFCKIGIIEKTRHYINHESNVWEVDEFHGDNQGLIVAEIELRSEDQNFKIPRWVGKEVTSDLRYYNMNLISFPYNKW